MKVESPAVKHDLQVRLRRIEGQVRGIQRMLDDERECHEIIQQLNAVQSALRNASRQFMRGYARECLTAGEKAGGRSPAALMDELLDLMEKVP